MRGVDVAEAFVPAIAPAMVGRGQNRYYPTEEAYVFAIAEALRTEYRAIVDAGFILQIDDPGLGETWDMLIPAPPLEEYRKMQARNIDALNHALDGIPEDRVRYHLCWGSWQGPHVHDLGLRDVVDLVLRVKAQAYSIEAATPRHSHEWRVWEDVKLPGGQGAHPRRHRPHHRGGRAPRDDGRAPRRPTRGWSAASGSWPAPTAASPRARSSSASTRPSCGPSSRRWRRAPASPRRASGGSRRHRQHAVAQQGAHSSRCASGAPADHRRAKSARRTRRPARLAAR